MYNKQKTSHIIVALTKKKLTLYISSIIALIFFVWALSSEVAFVEKHSLAILITFFILIFLIDLFVPWLHDRNPCMNPAGQGQKVTVNENL